MNIDRYFDSTTMDLKLNEQDVLYLQTLGKNLRDQKHWDKVNLKIYIYRIGRTL